MKEKWIEGCVDLPWAVLVLATRESWGCWPVLVTIGAHWRWALACAGNGRGSRALASRNERGWLWVVYYICDWKFEFVILCGVTLYCVVCHCAPLLSLALCLFFFFIKSIGFALNIQVVLCILFSSGSSSSFSGFELLEGIAFITSIICCSNPYQSSCSKSISIV